MKGAGRKEQIIEVTLELLRTERVEQVTTRRIATRVGVSQPALFRHFLNREAILIAVVDRTRDHFSTVAHDILKTEDPAMDALSKLNSALLSYVELNPGISRILFFDVASGREEKLRSHLRKLIEMQLAMVRTLVHEAIDSGELPRNLDSRQAANHWLAMVSGTILQWQVGGRRAPLASRADPLMHCWLSGIVEACQTDDVEPKRTERNMLDMLDVAPILERGQDPLDEILLRLDHIDPKGLLIVHVPFLPKPLLALMERRGHQTSWEEHGLQWEVWIHGQEARGVVDLRDLPMPEPMEYLLNEVSTLQQQECLVARTPRIPTLLLERLETMECETATIQCLDGSGLLGIRRSAK